MTLREWLLRVPVLGPFVERRWMPDPVERDQHRVVVRARLEAPVVAQVPADEAQTAQLTGGAPED